MRCLFLKFLKNKIIKAIKIVFFHLFVILASSRVSAIHSNEAMYVSCILFYFEINLHKEDTDNHAG